jgi:hypothetical protein
MMTRSWTVLMDVQRTPTKPPLEYAVAVKKMLTLTAMEQWTVTTNAQQILGRHNSVLVGVAFQMLIPMEMASLTALTHVLERQIPSEEHADA